MSYIFLTLLAALFYSFGGISGKIATKHKISNLFSLLFWLNITALIFVPFLWIKSGQIQNPFHLSFLIFILFFATASALMWWVLYNMDVSIFQSLFSAQSIFVTILAFFMLGEKFSAIVYIAIALMILGGFFISYDEKSKLKAVFNKNILLMVLVILLFAFSDIFAKKVLNAGLDPWNFKAWSLVGLAIIFIPSYFFAKKEIKISFNQVSPLLLNNFFNIVAHVAIYYAFLSNVTISQALAMFGSFFTLIITSIASKLYPKWLEHHSAKVYLIRSVGGIFLVISAILVILYGR